MKRLGILCIYDKDAIIDEYVFKIVQEICVVLEDLIIVSNCILKEQDYFKLSVYATNIVQRKNEGYDWGAWKDVITHHIGTDKLADYDELVLLNDTFYGPFYSFKSVFSKMENEKGDYDFWGLTVHGAFNKDGVLYAEHIQSYFLVVRQNMLHSDIFLEYWGKLKTYDDVEKTIISNEVNFTKYFSDRGFSYAVYCDTRNLEPEGVLKVNHYVANYLELIKTYKCPILKKKNFGGYNKRIMLQYNHADELKRTLDYIADNYNYDLTLIFKNFLRTANIATVHEVMNLNYILPNFYLKQTEFSSKKVCVICHIYYGDMIDYCLDYIKNIPNFIDIYITTSQNENLSLLKNNEIVRHKMIRCMKVSPRGRDLSAFFVGCKSILMDYDYICFIHDKKSLRKNMNVTAGKTFCDGLWNNLLYSEGYIHNIIDLMEKEKFLGLLVPPTPNYGEYMKLSDFWTGNFENVKRILSACNITIPLDEHFDVLSVGSAFWVKRLAIQKLLKQDWELEHFPKEPMAPDGTFSHALERVLPYVAQEAGFYTGILMNEDYAAAEINNLRSQVHDYESAVLDKKDSISFLNRFSGKILLKVLIKKILKKASNILPKI